MTQVIEEKRSEIENLCRKYRVQRLDVFGSAAHDRQDPERSDFDFVVEFLPLEAGEYAETYFGVLDGLNVLFDGRVDLVIGSAIKNRFFLEEVEETRVLLFAA